MTSSQIYSISHHLATVIILFRPLQKQHWSRRSNTTNSANATAPTTATPQNINCSLYLCLSAAAAAAGIHPSSPFVLIEHQK
jgi:hypothetical protein